MNRRIEKKVHRRYLADIGVELVQDNEWGKRLSNLSIDESIEIGTDELPATFLKLYPTAKKYKLNYEIKRVEFSSIPTSESSWWEVDNDTVYLELHPLKLKRLRWHASINIQ